MKTREGTTTVEAPRFVRNLTAALRGNGRAVVPGLGVFEVRAARRGKHRSFGGAEFAPRFGKRAVFKASLPMREKLNS